VSRYFRPFREPEANTLKACVDAQIFLTFLLSFILRVLNDDTIRAPEPLKAEFYGWTLLSSMALLLLTGVALTAAQVRRRRKFRQGLAMDAGLMMGVVSGVIPAAASSSVEHGSVAEQTH
jgi:heme/copper-type cytochrome/quinol oxidase subunit 3